MIKNQIKQHIRSWEQKSEWIVLLDLKIKGKNKVIIYGPLKMQAKMLRLLF